MAVIEVIKYEGDNSTFVWKYPKEDFNTESQLIVHESQEAVFFLNGVAMDLFGPGRYTLETANIPILSKLKNLPSGGVSPFHCEIYFINKVEQMAIKWGTDSKVQYMDSTYGFPISIGANGEMSLKVEDSRKLLVKLVGTERDLSQVKLISYFRALLMTKIKTYLSQIMKTSAVNIFEVDEHLIEFSENLKQKLIPDFRDYGISLERFFVTTIVKPDGEQQYEKFKEIHFRQYSDIAEAKIRQNVGVIDEETVSRRRVIEAKGIADKRSIEGYTYQQERGFDVAEKIAENEGTGNFSSAGIGMGLMAGIGGNVGNTVGNTFNTMVNEINRESTPQRFCDNCGAKISEGAEFCEECGTRVMTNSSCPKCGYVYKRLGKFCPKCGNPREK